MLTIGRALAAAIGLIAALAAVNAGSGQEGQGGRPPASFFGGGLEPGTELSLYVDGVECGLYEVQDNGEWAFHVHEGDCGGAAADGAEVSFAIGADAANETFAWRAGFAPHDLRNGIRLTVGGSGAPVPGGEAEIGVGGVQPGAAIRMLVDGEVCASGEPGQSGAGPSFSARASAARATVRGSRSWKTSAGGSAPPTRTWPGRTPSRSKPSGLASS